MKGVVDKFEAGHTPVVFINDGNDRVEGGTLYWDPDPMFGVAWLFGFGAVI